MNEDYEIKKLIFIFANFININKILLHFTKNWLSDKCVWEGETDVSINC